MSQVLEIAKPGKLPSGRTEIPFEIPLKAKGNKKLFETYHGVYISIQVKLSIWYMPAVVDDHTGLRCKVIVEDKMSSICSMWISVYSGVNKRCAGLRSLCRRFALRLISFTMHRFFSKHLYSI